MQEYLYAVVFASPVDQKVIKDRHRFHLVLDRFVVGLIGAGDR